MKILLLPNNNSLSHKVINDCIRAELALMKKLRPDRVLGVFRFTGKISAWLAGISYDSLI